MDASTKLLMFLLGSYTQDQSNAHILLHDCCGINNHHFWPHSLPGLLPTPRAMKNAWPAVGVSFNICESLNEAGVFIIIFNYLPYINTKHKYFLFESCLACCECGHVLSAQYYKNLHPIISRIAVSKGLKIHLTLWFR